MKKKKRTIEPPSLLEMNFSSAPANNALTVTELTERIRSALRDKFPFTIRVTGEISNLTLASSGHIYFTLKDQNAQIGCAMWKFKAWGLKFKLENGLAVEVSGRIDVYPLRGQYQLIAETLKPSGQGTLELAFRQLMEKLEKEGLFESSHKKPLPRYPLTIGVITSPVGAAVKDILRTLNLRWPKGKVLIYPVAVQGEESARQIVSAIKDLNQNAQSLNLDLIILSRGGGSLEDLWSFNEEIVARAIFASKLPIITGIGHEVDTTIADLVSDFRAATPTAAAQSAVPDLKEILSELLESFLSLSRITEQRCQSETNRLNALANRGFFRHPIVLLGPFAQRLDDHASSLKASANRLFSDAKNSLYKVEIALNRISPQNILAKASDKLTRQENNLTKSLKNKFTQSEKKFESLAAEFNRKTPKDTVSRLTLALQTLCSNLKTHTKHSLSTQKLTLNHLETRLSSADHRKILHRGFSLVRRKSDQTLITSAQKIIPNEMITTEFSDGIIISLVQSNNDET